MTSSCMSATDVSLSHVQGLRVCSHLSLCLDIIRWILTRCTWASLHSENCMKRDTMPWTNGPRDPWEITILTKIHRMYIILYTRDFFCSPKYTILSPTYNLKSLLLVWQYTNCTRLGASIQINVCFLFSPPVS